MSGTMRQRQIIREFADAMEERMAANDDKPGNWRDDTVASLFDRLDDEANELRTAIDIGDDLEAVIREGADVANFAMIIVDWARGMDDS